jgi:signal transduction histidine kinase
LSKKGAGKETGNEIEKKIEKKLEKKFEGNMGQDAKKDTLWYIIGRYLLQYRLTAAVFVMFSVISLTVFYLYRTEMEAVIYAAILCAVCAVIILVIHFFGYYKKHLKFSQIQKNMEAMDIQLPKADNLIEEDILEAARILQRMNRDMQNSWNAKRRESIDYYTTWVHQIKAPIAAMKLMLQGEDTDENKELLAELFRIEQYTEMVLSYFRLDSSSSDLVIRQYPLDDIIRQAIHRFAPQFVRKRIRLNYETTQILVLTDEKWLLFIIEQLLSNALKYTKEGVITIRVDEYPILYIIDTGIGIASEDIPRIFEKGFTGYNGRTDKKSTGLGLYLCKRAADKLSHGLAVSSKAGQGTSVQIDLRREKLEVE